MKLNRKYKIIYADPPWTFKNYNNEKSTHNADHHYPCMNMEDIKKIPVADLAGENCILFMWCTDPLLNKQIEVFSKAEIVIGPTGSALANIVFCKKGTMVFEIMPKYNFVFLKHFLIY